MQERTSTKETIRNNENLLTGMAEQAAKNCEHALRTGLRMQQEAGQWWSSMLDQNQSADDWQKRFNQFTSLANSLRPAAQKRMEEVLDLVEKNNRAGTELFKKATDATHTPISADSPGKWVDLWTSSLETVRSNAEAVMQINTRAMDSWIEFVQRHADIGQIRGSKAA